jgi:hypothetical protein
MSYKSKQVFKNNNTSYFQANVTKWTGSRVQEQLESISDSAIWIDQKIQMSGLTYDCSLGSLQEKTLTQNSSLAITNPVAGSYYTFIKKGNFTITLPSSHYSSSGATVPAGTVIVTFFYDGTNYFFNFSVYTLI